MKAFYASHHSTLESSSHTWTPEEVHEEVVSVQQVLRVRQTLFTTVRDWAVLVGRWSTQPLPSLNVAQLQRDVNSYVQATDYLETGRHASVGIYVSYVHVGLWKGTVTTWRWVRCGRCTYPRLPGLLRKV